jgi:hypothetical protein
MDDGVRCGRKEVRGEGRVEGLGRLRRLSAQLTELAVSILGAQTCGTREHCGQGFR